MELEEPTEMVPAFWSRILLSISSSREVLRARLGDEDGPERRDYIFHLALGGLAVFQEIEDVQYIGEDGIGNLTMVLP